jgi:uncharacterized protein
MALASPLALAVGSWPLWARGLLGLALFALGLVVFVALVAVEWGAWILVRPARRLKRFEPEPPPWDPIEIVAQDGICLRGAWIRAEHPRRCVLLVHGLAEDRSAMRDRAEFLARAGWTVVLPDARGHGQSEGHHNSFGAREAGDLRAWLDALGALLNEQPAWAVWGRSMGAAVALRAAAEDPRIKALVLEAPYPDLAWAVAGGLKRFRIPGALAHVMVRRAARLAGVSLAYPRPLDLAPLVHAHALVLHGTNDPIVPPAQAALLARAFPTPATAIEIPRARHTDLVEVGGAELMEQVETFLRESLA